MRLSHVTIGLATLMLAACGGGGAGGDAERQAFIAKAVNSCVETAQKGAPPPGVNVQSFCSCSVNRLSEGKNNEQLRDLDKQGGPSAADVAVMRQCMTEATGAAGK